MPDLTREELEAALNRIKDQEAAERLKALEATPPIWQFVIEPDDDKFDQVYDDSVIKYRIEGIVINKEEAEAAGHDIRTGGMTYLYNTLSKKLIMSIGGGHVWISRRNWYKETEVDEAGVVAWEAVERFIDEHPEGGDITDIISKYREVRGK